METKICKYIDYQVPGNVKCKCAGCEEKKCPSKLGLVTPICDKKIIDFTRPLPTCEYCLTVLEQNCM